MPSGVYPRKPHHERFWAKVQTSVVEGVPAALGECWLFVGAADGRGYGVFQGPNGRMKAHHWLVGKPPSGLEWDHLCRVHNCVRPSHLEAVTHKVNMERSPLVRVNGAHWRERTHCANGHEYTEANTLISRTNVRLCRQCRQERVRKWRKKQLQE